LIGRLLAPTGDTALANRPIPPGTAWRYARVPSTGVAQAPSRRPGAHPRIQVVRYALDSTVLPLITETLPVAEAARRALLYRLADVRGRREYGGEWCRRKHKEGLQPASLAGALSGKDEHRKPLTGHTHAYYLPTDEDGDGRIDHLTIVARDGFDTGEMRAVDRLREIRPRGRDNESHPLRVLMLGYGRLDEYQPAPLRPSREWISATPYIATRHAKTRGRHRIDLRSPQERAEFLIADLREQLRMLRSDLDGNTISKVEILPEWDDGVFRIPSCDGRRHLRPIQFKRYRSKPGDDGGRRLAGAFRIEFPRPVAGPIALGHSAHFGLGLFVPA
jgi:CRISPR-associated protein Csb2